MSELYDMIFRLAVKNNIFDFYIQKGKIYKLISLPVELVENYSNFRLEYLKKFHVPASNVSQDDWIDILTKVCENKRIEG